MKFILLSLISMYQFISPAINQLLGIKSMCRYTPTCSAYAKQTIEKQGVIKGVQLAIRRFLNCQPFSKSYGNI